MDWSNHLTGAQAATIREIKASLSGYKRSTTNISEGRWSVYMEPTTMPARYCELRRYLNSYVFRWKIEKDGRVSVRVTSRYQPMLAKLAA